MKVTNISLPECQNWDFPSFVLEEQGCVLIRLHNPDYKFPSGESDLLKQNIFDEVYEVALDDSYDIPDEVVGKLAAILTSAKNKNRNIVAHCHAGISRSGAVVEVATMMGFQDIGRSRNPNKVLKEKLRKALGIKHSFEE